MPQQIENYIHRIGRSGRYGRKGTAINLISGDDSRALKEIQDMYKIDIETLPQDLSKISLA